MPLALSFVPTQSSAGAPSGWERSLSDVRVFRVRPPPPDVQSLGGRRFPCGSAGIEFEDAALRDKLQSPTRVGVQKYPNQVGAPRPSLGDRESGGGWEAHLGTPRSSPDIRPHLGAEGAAAAEGTARWRTLHPSPRPTVASVRASLEPRPFYRCWTGRQEAASSCGLFSRAGLGEPGKETDSGAGARFPHVGMAPLRSLGYGAAGTARLALRVWFTMTGEMPLSILQLEKLRPKEVQKLVLGLAAAWSRALSPKSRAPSNPWEERGDFAK